MNFPEWAKNHTVSPEVTFAGGYLERHGYTFGEDFSVGTAIEKTAQSICEFLDDSEDWENQIKRISITGYSDWT